MICDISQNNLRENLENYVNGLIAANAMKGFDPKVITKIIFNDIKEETDDAVKALGIAYHVPSMVFRSIAQNPKFGDAKFKRLGYDRTALSEFIDNLERAEDKILAIAGYVNESLDSIDDIEERVNNVPADTAQVAQMISLKAKGVEAYEDKVLVASNPNKTTIQQAVEYGKNSVSPNETKPGYAYYQELLQTLLRLAAGNSDFTTVSMGGNTGFKLRLMFENDLPKDKVLPGRDKPDADGKIWSNFGIPILVLADNNGNILYFDKEGKKTNEANGVPWYNMLPTNDKSRKTAIESFKATYKQANEKDPSEEEIKNFEDNYNKQSNLLDVLRDELKYNKETPIILTITGGVQGSYTNVDSHPALAKTLSQFKLSNEEKTKGLQQAKEILKDDVFDIVHIKFDNFNDPISLKNPKTIGKDSDPTILDSIVDIMTNDVKVGGESLTSQEKLNYINQFLALKQNLIEADAEKRRLGRLGYTIQEGPNNTIIFTGGGQTLTDKQSIKDFLANNATIHWHKETNDKGSYFTYKLTPLEKGLAAERSEEKDYFSFIAERFVPRVILNETTKRPMITNGYLTFERENTVKEVEQKVIETTKEVVENKIPTNIEEDDSAFEELKLRSRLFKTITTPEQRKRAEKWWKESGLSKAVDSNGKPLFTLNLLFNVVNSDAWADYENAVINLYEGSDYTHAYHEAWHAFSQVYLTKSERNKLYEAVSKLSGSFKVVRKLPAADGTFTYELQNVKFSDAERIELEEFIAEEFRNYAMNGGKFKVKNEKTSFLSKIFDRIWKALKALVGGSTDVNVYSNPGSSGVLSDIFNTLYTAKTPEQFLPYKASMKNAEFGKLNSGVVASDPNDNLSQSEALLFTKTIDGIFSDIISNQVYNKGNFNASVGVFDNPKALSEIYKVAKARLDAKRKELVDESKTKEEGSVEKYILDNKISLLTRALKETTYGSIADILNGNSTDTTLIGFHKQNSVFKDMFGKLKISKEEAEELKQDPSSRDDNEQTEMLEKNGSEGFKLEANSTESDKLAPAVVLYIIKSLTKIDKQGKPVLNELGFAEPIEFAPFWRQLMDKASGETSVLGLYNRLKEAEDKGFPLFGQLLKKIFINKVEQDKEGKITRVYTPEETLQSMLTVKNSSIGDLWMKFIQATNLHRIDLVSTTIEVDGDGNLILKSGKTTADYQPILKLWANKFQDQSKSLFVGKTKDNINYIKTEQVVKAFINVDKGKYYVNREDYLPFLNSIGIYLTDVAEVRDGLKADDIDYIAEAIVKHNEYYKDISDLKESKITSIRDFLTIDHKAEKITNQASRFNYLAELEAMYSEEYASSMKFTPDGNLKSIHALNSSTTQKVKALNSAQRKDYLFSTNDEYVHMNFLNPEFNPLAKTNILLNSLFSKTEEGQRIKDNFIEIVDRAGTNDIVKGQYDKGGVYAKMGINDKVISDFIATLDGGYMHSVTPGDKSSYFSIVLDKIFTYEGKKNPKLYVDTEAWLKDDNGNYIRGYNPMVKFFQILYPKLEAEVKRINMIKQGWDKIYSKREGFKAGLEFDIFDDILETNEKYKSGMTLKDYLKSEQFFKSLTEAGNIQNLFNTDSALKTAIDSQMNTWFNALREAYSKNIYNPVFGNVKTRFGTDKANTVFSDLIQKNLDANEKARVNSSSIREAGEWSYLVNNFIHKIETTVLLHGDGFQFNHSKDDSPKRASGAQSSGRVFPVDAITNLWINNVVGRRLEEKLIADGLITKKEGKNEVRKHTPIMNSAIMQEPEMGSAFFEMYAKLFKKDFENKGLEGDALKIALYGEKDGKIGTGKLKKDGTFDTYPGGKMHPYSKIESADGQGWISFDSYRILKKLEGMWSDDQEAAYSRIVNGETLSPGELIELFPVYKLQYNGPLHTPGQYPAQAFHKFSLFPLIPGAIAGKPIEKISMAMMEQNIDYVLSPTGSKRSYIKPSAEQNGDPVYTGNTSNVKNINEITFTKNPIYVAYLKNQTDVNSFFKEESTFSTQLRKLITAGLYEFGIPTDFYKEGKFKDPEDAILAWGKLTEAEKKQTSEYHRLSERLKDAIEDLVEEAKIELLESIKWTEEDLNKTSKELAAESPEKLKELFGLINKELKEQDFSDHERSILEASSNLDKLDASSAPLAARFEKVIRSILNKRLIRLKLRGEPFVEVSSDYMQQTVKFTKPSEEQQKAYDNFGNGTNGLSSYVVDIKGKKKTLGFRFKRALTRHDERLFNTYFYDQKGSRVPIKNDKGVIIGYEKIGVFDEVDGQKKLNIKASLARLNQMINNNEWLEDDDNKKKIRLVGVRIPVQADNSAEFGQVAEFLDPSAGTIIIIPAEIVPKSGTDFDVDKMTAYLPYITRTGKLIEKKVSKKSLDDKITKAKEKIDAFKKNKEIIAEFKESKGVKWLDIGEKLFEFREILKKEKKSKNIFLDKKTLEKLLYSKSKELVEYLNNNEEYVKRSFPKAYAFYKKSAAGVSVSEIVEAEKAVSKLYEENNEFRKAFDELKDLQDHKNNYDSVIQNDIIDIMTSILELPGKAISLLSPNATNLVEPVADELKEKISEADGETDYSKYTLTGKSIKGISPTSMYREDYNNKRQQENISGKGSLGITAIENYMNNLLNMVGLTMNKTVSLSITRKGKKNAQVIHEIDVPLAHNRLNGKISLTHIMDAAKENSIADIIAQLMNGFVDVGKKAWVAYIQGNMEVIPKILFMIEIGVPFKDIAYFVSNPITREYVKEKKKKMSIHSTLMYDESFSSSFDAAVKTKTEIFNNIDLSKLSNDALLNIEGANANIFGYDAASKELAGKNTFTREALKKVAESKLNYKNKDQVAGFMQYLYIENLIEDYDLVKRAMNPDTKETSDFYGDDARIEEVKKTQELKSIDTEPINKLRTNSLISPLFIQEFAKKLFGRVFRLRNDERINKYLRDLYSHKFKRSGPKKVTGYDMETYITKFKNFLGQYLFANELRQYNSALGTFKAKTTDKAEIVDKAVLEELNQEYDYISSLTPKDEFVQNKANFNNLDLAAFKEAGRQDYIEYALQRQYLAKTVKLEDVVDTKEFAKRKERLQKTASAKYMQKAGQPNDVYEEELNELVFQDYLTNTALKNSYNIWQLFRSGDNTVATELMDIINNYPDLTKVTTFSMLSNFAAEGIPRASYTDRKVKNFKLKNYKALGEGLSDDYKNQWDKLSNPSDKDLINLVPDLKARQYISNFFQTLPLYSFLQTGMDASEFSLASVMPYERYKEIFNKASDKFIAMLDEYSFAKERGNKIEIVKEYNNMLRGLQVLFNDQNRLDNIPYRNRGLNYKKPLDKIAGADKRNPIYSLYDIPYLLPQGNKGVFIMQNSYEQDGVMVEAKIDIEDLESRYTDVVFLTSLNDLTKQADVFNLTTEEIEAAKTSIDAVLNKIISEGSAVVIYPEGLMGKSNITTAKPKAPVTKTPEVGDVVEYKGQAYILWNINPAGKAQLTAADGSKFSGTPEMNKLSYLKSLPKVEFNNKMFVVDSKDRIFSLSTGNEVYKNATEKPQVLAKLKKQPTQAPVSTQVITFETAAGSKYTLYPDGKIDRYKTATKEKQETNDLIVFVKFNSSEQMQRFLEGVQEREKSGTKVYVIDNKGNKYSKGLDIKGKDVKLALVDTKTNKVIETVETKQEPTIGYNTYDESRYSEKGEQMRRQHLGNKVTKIAPSTQAPVSTEDKNEIKEGIDFVFEQNSELANAVYEAVGLVRSDKVLSENYENYFSEIQDMNSAIFDNLENADLLYTHYEIKELDINSLNLSKKTAGYSKNA
ncbi:MAG TPA: hypothetical protein PLT51_00600, partial [Candidatus Dojkabacteria bacterium]|nr:hypothetical protein [Candidatus Dojkabacteria bacterium]